MFVLDIETAGTFETAVVLQIGMIHVSNDGLDKILKYDDIGKNSIFIKTDSKDQIKRFNRSLDKSTLEWWAKQSSTSKEFALRPSNDDVTLEVAMDKCKTWINKMDMSAKDLCFVRGSMDGRVLDHVSMQLGIKPLFAYNRYRDVRTFIDCMYPNSKNGYVDIDTDRCVGYDEKSIVAHHPIHDCCRDFAMMMFGKTN